MLLFQANMFCQKYKVVVSVYFTIVSLYYSYNFIPDFYFCVASQKYCHVKKSLLDYVHI